MGVLFWNIENVLDKPLRLLFIKLAVAWDDANSDGPDDAVDVTLVVVVVVVVFVADVVDAKRISIKIGLDALHFQICLSSTEYCGRVRMEE